MITGIVFHPREVEIGLTVDFIQLVCMSGSRASQDLKSFNCRKVGPIYSVGTNGRQSSSLINALVPVS